MFSLRRRATALRGTRPPTQAHLTNPHRIPPAPPHQTRRYTSSPAPHTTTGPPANPSSAHQQPDPLRILFCGADHFSCASLSALHALHTARPDLIESIDVLVRPGKPAGRGLKRIAVGPLFALAHALGLPLHQRDTFTGWAPPLPGHVTHPTTGAVTVHRPPPPSSPPSPPPPPPQPFNLLIAVSFGLFVPPRVLRTLAHGGLNVHPSLLPDLRGPAPVPWAILRRRPCTGVTLQTLHPSLYDRGAVLAQTPPLPVGPAATAPALLAALGRAAAALLVQGLLDGVHLRRGAAAAATSAPPGEDPADAPKITKADLAVDWAGDFWARGAPAPWSAADLARRYRAVGTQRGLWTYAHTVRQYHECRLLLDDIEAVRCPPALREVVRQILRAKVTAARGGTTDGDEEVVPSEVGNVVFASQKDMAFEARMFRLPVYANAVKKGQDGASVMIPIRVPYRIVDGEVEMVEDAELDAIRVGRIKSEGFPTKKATLALQKFWEGNLRMQDFRRLDYAADVMARRVH